MIAIRLYRSSDWIVVWRILEPVFRAGETYPFAQEITESAARENWIDRVSQTFVAVNDNDQILGTYYLKPNQSALGAHVCNSGYVVATEARRQGVASAMCRHSHQEAVARGYQAMQYNLVVSTNEQALRLWQKHGMEIVGTLPKAFRHAKHGYVDAHILYKWLGAESENDTNPETKPSP